MFFGLNDAFVLAPLLFYVLGLQLIGQHRLSLYAKIYPFFFPCSF